jgi:uncharacterized Zn finger protein (UPF0148 family)
MLRIVCALCRHIFFQLTPVDDGGVVCPRCGAVFTPREEELVDPEDE